MSFEPSISQTAHAPVQQLHALTSLRFFAAIYVLLFHYMGWLAGAQTSFTRMGSSGVTFFFILSGFILSHNYQNFDFSDRSSRHRYYAARLARIYPVLLVSLFLSLPFALAQLARMPSGVPKLLAGSSLLLAPLGLHAWVPGAACFINCPSWSISTEFFFYLLLPSLISPILRQPAAWLAGTLLFWLVVSLIYIHAWATVAPAGASLVEGAMPNAALLVAEFIKFFPIGRLPEFMLGIGLYAAWKRGRASLTEGPALLAFALGALAVAALAERLPEAVLHNGLTAIAWAPLIWAAASMQRGPLCSPLAIYLGRISFSLYLLHVPVMLAFVSLDKRILGAWLVAHPPIAILVATALALSTSAAVYALVEEPFRSSVMRWLLCRWSTPAPPRRGHG